MSRTALTGVARRWSAWTGVRIGLHGLRHAAVTSCLDAGHDVRAVQRFARYKSLETTLIYDDNGTDIGGKVAAAHVARLEAARKMLEATLPDETPGGAPQGGREDGGGGDADDRRRRGAGPGAHSGGASIGKDDGGPARK